MITIVSNDIQTRHLQTQVELHYATDLLNPCAVEMTLLNNVKSKTFIVIFRGAHIMVSGSPR
jgi:hypothetical protein